MLVNFQTAGPTDNYLADDTNAQGGGKKAFVWSGLELNSEVQVSKFFRGAAPAKTPRSNKDARLVFAVDQTLASRAAVQNFIKAAYALLNSTGTLTFTDNAVAITCANAVLRNVQINSIVGVRILCTYHFETTTLA